MILKLLTFFLPWTIRRKALESWFGFTIHPTAKIGYSWIWPKQLIMAEESRIDNFTVAVNLDRIKLGYKSKIGRGNWITGFPSSNSSKHFKHQPARSAELIIGDSSAITKNHHIDCTNIIEIGSFTTVAGYNSQLLTHSINVFDNRQDSAPISIGDYCFIATNTVILGGSTLPSRSVLGAKSLLNKSFSKEWTLYGGVPAKELREIPFDAKYFTRSEGFVY